MVLKKLASYLTIHGMNISEENCLLICHGKWFLTTCKVYHFQCSLVFIALLYLLNVFLFEKGRWKKEDLKKLVTFSHVVRSVVYNEATDDFTVIAENLLEKKVLPPQTFDFVCVASGHYSVPFTPAYPGVETFPGRVMHSHDFRNAKEFAGQKVLLVISDFPVKENESSECTSS